MDESLTIPEIKKRIVKAFVSLTLRQIALRAVSFITINLILASTLSVETLGIFNIATGIVTFFIFFADVGLAASLIQKKDQVREVDIKTFFTIQFLLVGIVSLLIILFAANIAEFYQLDQQGIFLIQALGLSFFITSLKVIPAVLLERDLKFQPLVLIEIVETILFNGLLIILTSVGLTLQAFAIAAILRSVVGTVLIYLLNPVKIRVGIDKESAKELLNFGIPFQLNNILALLKDRLVPLVVAKIIGSAGVGFVTWSQNLAFLPLEVMSIIIRITFPAFSRMQHDRQALARAVDKSLLLTTFIVYPLLFGMGAILSSLVEHIVSTKWAPAIPSFYLFAFSSYWGVISTTYTNTLNSIGHIKTTLKLMVFWTIITWVLTPFLSVQFGYLGVAMSSFLISFTSVITIILIRRVLQVNTIKSVFVPTICSLIMALIVFLTSQIFVRDKPTLILTIIFGGLIYLTLTFIFLGKRIFEEIENLKNA